MDLGVAVEEYAGTGNMSFFKCIFLTNLYMDITQNSKGK